MLHYLIHAKRGNKTVSGKNNTATMTKLNLDVELEKKYKLVLHNDDTTPMDLVIAMLMGVLLKSQGEAIKITMFVHEHGKAVVLAGSKEYLDEKRAACIKFVTQYGYSDFRVTVEED